MEEMLYKIFTNDLLVKKIEFVKEKYQLGIEEDISLKSLLLFSFLLTRDEHSPLLFFDLIVSEIISSKGKNNYDVIVNKIIDHLFEECENDYKLANTLIYQYIIDGYCFHSFNSAFLSTIQAKGLILGDKPWDNHMINDIQMLFKSHHVNDVFGLYCGTKKYPIFFANSLKSSRFYAYSSPTWFRHFVSGGMVSRENFDKTAFFYRNHDSALQNVIHLCHVANLTPSEEDYILTFFEQHWKWIATDALPLVALVKKDVLFDEKKSVLEPLEGELASDYVKRIIRVYGEQNLIVRNDVDREDILLFPYDLTKFDELIVQNGKKK